jgi:CMP-N,N'-diacetyllegionaminic acid synthase
MSEAAGRSPDEDSAFRRGVPNSGEGHVLALIPARGGSKSIPRKNLRLIAGKPLVAYSIQHALGASRVDRVIVSTDDPEIAETAMQYGAEVPFLRPKEISGDFAVDVDFHRHALEWLQQNEDYVPFMVVNLRPTHPLRRCETIDSAIEVFASNPEADSLRSIRLSNLSPYKMWRIGVNNRLIPVVSLQGMREPYNSPRQLLPLAYWQDGYVDITRPSVVMKKNSTTGDEIIPFIIDEPCVEIDYEDEIAAAERLLSAQDTPPLIRSAGPIRHPS